MPDSISASLWSSQIDGSSFSAVLKRRTTWSRSLPQASPMRSRASTVFARIRLCLVIGPAILAARAAAACSVSVSWRSRSSLAFAKVPAVTSRISPSSQADPFFCASPAATLGSSMFQSILAKQRDVPASASPSFPSLPKT